MARKPVTKPLSPKDLDEQLAVAEKQLALTEIQYTQKMWKQLTKMESELAPLDPDEGNWSTISSGGQYSDDKIIPELQKDPKIMRKQAYKYWRLQPHARGILRNFVRFIIGREFGFDFDDDQHGEWNDDHTKFVLSDNKDKPLVVKELWKDFSERNLFIQKAKELVLRTMRDGEMFLRKFEKNGRITIRFIEPEKIGGGMSTIGDGKGEVQPDDVDGTDIYTQLTEDHVGEPTVIKGGIEYLANDAEVCVAFYVSYGDRTPERVPAKDIIHTKALADSNDPRGIPILEVVAKRLTNYDLWEEYRMTLNRFRSSIALVRKIDGTAAQANQLLANRASPRPSPTGREPVTQSGRREPMFKPGTILNPSPGLTYEFLAPKLEARDAGEDGRRILLSIAAGVGLPEMLVTGDWSNSNYASSVESRTPSVREWEDWQDFFEPVFKRIYRWVIIAAFELGLPKDTSQEVTLVWPQLVAKDELKESQRGQILNGSGILSKRTWAKNEGLDYEDEVENMSLDNELEVSHASEMDQHSNPQNPQMSGFLKNARAAEQQKIDNANAGKPNGNGSVNPFEKKTQAEALMFENFDDLDLNQLDEVIDSTIDDPALYGAMVSYMKVARKVTRRDHAMSQNMTASRRKKKRQWRMA